MSNNYGDSSLSREETLNAVINTYNDIFEEIEKGYESGTRETYIEDKNSEKGYRKLTKEEEIEFLNEAYKNYAHRTEKEYEEREKFAGVLEEYIKKISNVSNSNSKALDNAQKALKRIKGDKAAKNFEKNALNTIKFIGK